MQHKFGEREWNLKPLGFKFLFHMFGLRFLEKELETLRFQVPLKWGELEPLLLWGVQVFIPKGSRFIFF